MNAWCNLLRACGRLRGEAAAVLRACAQAAAHEERILAVLDAMNQCAAPRLPTPPCAP